MVKQEKKYVPNVLLRILSTNLYNFQELYSNYDDDDEEADSDYYAPLTCDMCQETFRTPALWVRHIQTHELGSITDLPKRKRRKTTVRVLYLFAYASTIYIKNKLFCKYFNSILIMILFFL